jgi:3-phenylpropionate/trans-cinnamate dioxygenase ferredoxin subunit
MTDFVKVAAVDEIPEGSLKKFDINQVEFVLAHTAQGFYAFPDECTHDGAPFGGGKLEGQEVICPRHGARFNVATGAVTAPPALVPIDTYEVKVDGNDILVRLD